MKKYIVFVLTAFCVIWLAGCGKKAKILARVDNGVITVEEFEERINRLPNRYQEIARKQKRKFLDDLVKEKLLYAEALKEGIDKDRETQEIIAEAKKKILISSLIKNRVGDKLSITEDEITQYYDGHSEEFMLPERWRASHILVNSLEEAKEIKEKLNQGASFEELAKNRSTDATAEKGGDVGYFSKGQLVPEFEQACFDMEAGEVSDVVKTQFGYHIIKLTEKKSPEVQKFTSVKALIKKDLEKTKRTELLTKFMDELQDNASITINEELLEVKQEKPDAEK